MAVFAVAVGRQDEGWLGMMGEVGVKGFEGFAGHS